MAWTYDPNLKSTKDQIRFLVQDTNTSRQLFQDEEIKWVFSTEANIYMAAAMLADSLVAKAGSVKFKKISEFSIQYDPMFYRTLSMNLRSRGMSHQIPYAGGISNADNNAQKIDTDNSPSVFARMMEENQAAPKADIGHRIVDPLTRDGQ